MASPYEETARPGAPERGIGVIGPSIRPCGVGRPAGARRRGAFVGSLRPSRGERSTLTIRGGTRPRRASPARPLSPSRSRTRGRPAGRQPPRVSTPTVAAAGRLTQGPSRRAIAAWSPARPTAAARVGVVARRQTGKGRAIIAARVGSRGTTRGASPRPHAAPTGSPIARSTTSEGSCVTSAGPSAAARPSPSQEGGAAITPIHAPSLSTGIG